MTVEGHEQIQIIDVTARVKFDFAMVDKRIQELINAMVSHELRNPLNSIQNQNFLQQCINEKIEEIIHDEGMKTEAEIKAKLKTLLKDSNDSNDLNNKCIKLLKFLINDILDYAHL